MFFGFKGQGFDVFKLLIAAVVAGAILIILLQVLQILPSIGSESPNNSAANAVKSKVNELGLPVIINNVTFNNGDSLNAKTIAQQSKSISSDQICVLVSDSAPNRDNFEVKANGKIVVYDGFVSQQTRLIVLCDRANELETSLEDYGYDEDPYNIDIGSCGTFDSSSTSRFCVVAIIPG